MASWAFPQEQWTVWRRNDMPVAVLVVVVDDNVIVASSHKADESLSFLIFVTRG
jgi:hypothetical protein